MLTSKTEIPVRFNEADPLGIVWHGHYVRYFEDGREAFGNAYELSYLDFYKNGLAVPVVSVHCDYKKPLKYGDTMRVHTIYQPTPAAKLLFRYEIYDVGSNELVARGSSVQVFVDSSTFDLHLTIPDFFAQWKARWEG